MSERPVTKSKQRTKDKDLNKARKPADGPALASKSRNRATQRTGVAAGPAEKVSLRIIFPLINKSRLRQKQLRLAEAMREEGLDESALARAYAELVQKLFNGEESSASDKLLVDLLKEMSRTLEPQSATGAAASSASDLPVVVQLLHEVPRPVRAGGGETAIVEGSGAS
jgi:hypothetical protein